MSLDLSKVYAALVASAVVVAAPAAQAFTIENGDGGATAGANLMAPSPFNDPAKKDTDRDGGTRTQFGGGTVYVGPAGSSVERDYQTGINRMFSPLGRPSN
jgi:hypothetical protein